MAHTRFFLGITVPVALVIVGACTSSTEQGSSHRVVMNDSTGSTMPASDTTKEEPVARFPEARAHAGAALAFTIIDAPNGTFGYEIQSDGKLLIHQTNLPGQPGNDGCKTKADAEKLAAFVVEKIKKGEMPPTVSSTELQELRIIP